MLVREIMTSPAYSVPEDASPRMALALLTSKHLTSLPVVDGDGDVVGVISEADLLRVSIASDPRAHLRHGGHAGDDLPERVADLMTRSPEIVLEDADVADVARIFAESPWKSLPVVRGRRLQGVVSRSDVMRALARPDAEIFREVTESFATLGSALWTVRVSGGVVEIDGPRSDQERDLAASLAAQVVGVRKVAHVGSRT